MTTETSTKTEQPGKAKSTPRRSRNAADSKSRILEAAKFEFCKHGFNGARVERISKRSGANMRMLYHYFGSKEGLYIAALEAVYINIRTEERKLKLDTLDPVAGMRQLITFTFDFFASHMDFIGLINNENLLKGKFIKRCPSIHEMTIPLVCAIEDLLKRGAKSGTMRADVAPVQLYISIAAQCQLHISSRYTLSAAFDQDLGDEKWMAERRQHAEDVIMGYLTNIPPTDKSKTNHST